MQIYQPKYYYECITFDRPNFNGLLLGEGIQDALEDDEQIDVSASFERLLHGIRGDSDK